MHSGRLDDWHGTPWARATKKVHKPPGEKGRMFRKSKMLLGPKVTFLII